MKVGLYFDLRNPPEWRTDSSRLYGFTLEMCEEAERLGAHSLWFTEHHLFEDGYLTQPLTYCAAVAARTRRVRLGTAILIAPLQRPVPLAEQAVVVDLISGGRLDLGLGTGYRVPEFELYGVSLERRYAATDECARQLRALWGGVITPAPAQARIPIWMGYQGPQGAHRAGLLGEGLLSINPELLDPYRQGLREAGHDASIARMCGAIEGWVSEDPEKDWPVVARHLAYQQNSYRRYAVEGTGRPQPKPVNPDTIRSRGATSLGGPYFYGDPATVAATINTRYAGLPIECVYLWASVAGMPEKMVADNIRTILEKFAPLLQI